MHDFVVSLPRWSFRVIWLLVVAFHAVNLLYLVGVGAMYNYIVTPGMVYFAQALNLPSVQTLRAFGALFWVFASFHGIAILRLTGTTLQRRRMSFAPPWMTVYRACKSPAMQSRHRIQSTDIVKTRRGKFSAKLKRFWNKLEHLRYTLLSVESRYFDVSFGFREAIEIGLQTYQAYSLSLSVSRNWINVAAVAIIALNCLSTPLIAYLQTSKRITLAQSRLLCLTCDAVLDFCSAVIVPLVVFVPYWQAFDPSIHDFPGSKTYYEVWYTNAIQENRQVFILNPLDFVSSIMPHISVLSSTHTVKSLLVESSPQAALQIHPRPLSQFTVRAKFRRVGTTRGLEGISNNHRWANHLLHFWSISWVVFVATAHSTAHHNHAPVRGCNLHNNAWFVSKYSCAVIDLNCYQLDTHGDADTLGGILDQIDTKSLSLLAVSHCTNLSIPTSVRHFPMLYAIIVYNSTLEHWPDDASPHRDHHQILNYIEFVHVNFSHHGLLPHALTHADLPPTFNDLEIYGSNLREIPPTASDVWENMCTLYIEFTAIDTVPLDVFHLPQLQFLSLAGNPIAILPDGVLMNENTQLQYVTLSATQITELPANISVQNYDAIQEIDFEMTMVMTLPEWVLRWYDEGMGIVMGYGSAFCVDGGAAMNDSAVEALRPAICETDLNTYDGLIAVKILDEQHALDRQVQPLDAE